MSEALHTVIEPTRPDFLTSEELVTLNNYLGNHEAKLAVAGIYAVLPVGVIPKSQIRKHFFNRQVPANGNPTSPKHIERIKEAGGWTPRDTHFANWCVWSLEPAGILEEAEYQGQKGPQLAWRATELATRALPYVGGLGEWSLNYADISLQHVTGATKSTADSKARAPQVRHSIFRKLVSDRPDDPSTYQDLELAAAAEGLRTGEVSDAVLELTYQGLLVKNPPNFDGRSTLEIADKYQGPIRDLVQTLEDITTPDGTEHNTARAFEILSDPELFLPLIAKAKRFSAISAGHAETHSGLQRRITEALQILGRAEVSSIYKYLQASGRTTNRHTIHKTMRELLEDETVEAFDAGSELALSNIAATYALK